MPHPNWAHILWQTHPAPSGETAATMVPGKRALVLFEDNLSPVRRWQTELLKLDREALREMDIAVLCIAADDGPSMINGCPCPLPVEDLRRELQGDIGKFEAILLDKDANILLRSETPVTIGEIKAAVTGEPPAVTE